MKAIRWIAMLGICCLSISTFGGPDLSESQDTMAGVTNITAPEPTATAVTNAEVVAPAPPDVNAPIANDGSTALHVAAQFNRLDEVKLLLEKGADINAANNIGITPLHLAALAGHNDMVALLLAHKADVKTKDVFGLTSLHCAAQYGHAKTMYLLLDKGAEIESKTYTQGLTPLHWAAFWGHIEGIKCLLNSGADINACDNNGNTPLTWAEAYGQHDMARLLARKGGRRHDHEKLYGLDASWHIY
ncbi:MAG: ankyrin repeat domain-containing protein [Kiritimatiellae bacterium]|nr:ankyrin repeat domain-containing protein [Kiritimatiellia bacterium]